jgi:chemotaxis protein MotB
MTGDQICAKRNISLLEFTQGTTVAVTVLLLLGGCVSRTKYEELAVQYQKLSERLSSQIIANRMQIANLQYSIKVTVNNELLFPSGGWQMPVEAQQAIAPIITVLASMPRAKIMVNGYTDNRPVGSQLISQGITSNLVLSQKRADNVLNFMAAQGFDRTLMSAQGFGDTNRVATNHTAAGRAQNRRVELILNGYHGEMLSNSLPPIAVVAPSSLTSSSPASVKSSAQAADPKQSNNPRRIQVHRKRHCIAHCSIGGGVVKTQVTEFPTSATATRVGH